jgi:vacuolar-type H+-ATPase subunit B/Vma2
MNDKMSIFALMTDMSFSCRALRHGTLENETIKMQKGWSN